MSNMPQAVRGRVATYPTHTNRLQVALSIRTVSQLPHSARATPLPPPLTPASLHIWDELKLFKFLMP